MSDSSNTHSSIDPAMKKVTLTSLTLAASLCLVSCGNFKAASLATKPFKSVANLIPKRIPIAEVRTKDLQKMTTGADKALAFEKKQNRRRFAFFRSLYKEPKLPDAQSLPADAGILPPLKRSAD